MSEESKEKKNLSSEEKEKQQLADSYIPNAWDEWKKKALQKEDWKAKNWEA